MLVLFFLFNFFLISISIALSIQLLLCFFSFVCFALLTLWFSFEGLLVFNLFLLLFDTVLGVLLCHVITMFLRSMSVNGLLPEEKGKHVLRKWSVEHKRAVCNSVISGLLASYAQAPRDGEDGDEDLLSDFESLNWTMEVVGAAFALPFDDKVDLTICQGALNLLFRWLLSTDEPSARPRCDDRVPIFYRGGRGRLYSGMLQGHFAHVFGAAEAALGRR